MTVLETMLRFTAAWLAVGLGMFVASGAFRVMIPATASGHPHRAPLARALAVLPFVAGVALVAVGLLQFVRVVPW